MVTQDVRSLVTQRDVVGIQQPPPPPPHRRCWRPRRLRHHRLRQALQAVAGGPPPQDPPQDLAVSDHPRPPAARISAPAGAEDFSEQPRLQQVRRGLGVDQGAVRPDQRPAQQRLHLQRESDSTDSTEHHARESQSTEAAQHQVAQREGRWAIQPDPLPRHVLPQQPQRVERADHA
eukprot:SAG31_NODE_3298_length_4446_cov_24.869335_1_plen_176_part_00